MNRFTSPPTQTRLAAAALALAAAFPLAARAQDYGAMLQQKLAESAQLSRTMQQTQNNMVQQAMQNPQIRAGYAQYLAQMRQRGGQAMDFPTYAYYYMYTNGFSNSGIAHMNRVESGNRAAEMNAWNGVREAERNRSDAMRTQNDSYYRNHAEAGRGLMGQSTYYGPNGTQSALPHTWQNNSYQRYQGNNYYVDHSGQYYRVDPNGWMVPISR